MELRRFLVLIFSQVLLPKIGSTTLKPVADPSIPVTLEQKMAEMEKRLEKKLTARIEADVKDLSARLDGQREEIIKKISDAVHATTVVSERLENAKRTFIQLDTHLLEEVQRASSTLSEATENIRRLQQEVAKADNLQINSTLNQADDLSIEDTVLFLKDKMTQMEQRMSSFELSLTVQDSQKACLEDKNEILKRVEEVETRCADISARLQDAEVRFLRMDTHLLVEVQQAREESGEAIERVSIAEQELASALESKTDILQVKMNKTREMLNSFVASQRDNENVIRKNISSSTEKLMHLNDSLSSRFESLTTKMRIFENTFLEIEKDYANISLVSKLDQSLQHLNKTMKTDIQSIESELSPRVEQLEVRCALCQDVAALNKTLRNHTFQINALNTDILDIQKICDGEPPAVKNGKTLDFERNPFSKVRYECYPGFVMSRYSTVRCQKGEWDGQPPVCRIWDATFYLRTWSTSYSYGYIYCKSYGNGRKIVFSRVLDTGSGAHLPAGVRKSSRTDDSNIDLTYVPSPGKSGSFQCGYGDELGSWNISVQRQDETGDLYFEDHSKVANIGDAVELEVKFDKKKKLTWRLNGLEIPSWKNQERVGIPSVQPSDSGIYECNYEGQRGVTAPALLRLIVRKCQKNLFGEHCEQQCPPCYNGGICHDHFGVCVCPPGFSGDNCEIACGEERWAEDCSRQIGEFSTVLLCRPDPYGCACSRGWKGFRCDELCEPGWYGADCKQPCHCSGSPQNCDRVRGTCSKGCSPGWTGQSCQIQVVD